MTPLQIVTVQRSFDRIDPVRDRVASLFYERLFTIDPSSKCLFHGDMVEQRKKLMVTLATTVAGLTHLPSILGTIEDMARRHIQYGVEARHYDSAGEALIWAMEQTLGGEFTPDVKEAWIAAYATLAGAMKAAAYGKNASS